MASRLDELQAAGAVDAVLRSLARWPNVPDCYGWLFLDRRGGWRLGAEREPIRHPGLSAAIAASYFGCESGWFFQNGPQRVWVELEQTPYVLQLADSAGERFRTHTGMAVQSLQGGWLDAQGNLGLLTEHGAAIVDDRDLARLGERLCDAGGAPLAALPDPGTPLWLQLESQRLALEFLPAGRTPAAHYGFVAQPRAADL
ncbi:MAG: DUF2946 family protein [Rhodocyclaceae bacterium]|nr:DUF2946 family protein [Rhodocyclaceae bacterium]MBX3666893.1 DUF2946 family protein [Rhodocyclaceae bacterium]